MDFIICFLKKAHHHFLALRLRVQEHHALPFFIPDVPFQAISILTQQNNRNDIEHLMEALETEMNNPLKLDCSMWRAKIISTPNKKQLIATFHHSIFDGRSIIKLIHLLTPDYQKVIQKNNKVIYPPIEASVSLAKSQQESDYFSSQNFHWLTDQTSEMKKQISRCCLINLDDIDIGLIKQFCRQQGISVNQLLNAVVMNTIAILCPNRADQLIHTPVDLAMYSKQYDYQNEVGCFIAVVPSRIPYCDQNTVLSAASIYSRKFNQNFNHSIIDKDFDFYHLKNRLIRKFSKATTDQFLGGIAVSNVGEICLKKLPIIKDILFSTTLLGGLGVFVLSVLTIRSRFRMTISYTEPLLSQDFVALFVQLFKNRLRLLVQF